MGYSVKNLVTKTNSDRNISKICEMIAENEDREQKQKQNHQPINQSNKQNPRKTNQQNPIKILKIKPRVLHILWYYEKCKMEE